MKKYIFLILVLSASAINSYSIYDEDCSMLEITNSESNINALNNSPCTQVNLYTETYNNVFKPTNNQDVITIRVNFIFVQRNDGTGNFSLDSLTHKQFFDEVVAKLNRIYAEMENTNDITCNKSSEFISDARIKFDVKYVAIRDTYGWNNDSDLGSSKCPDNTGWYLNYLDDRIKINPEIPKGINVYFTVSETQYQSLVIDKSTTQYGGGSACSQFPSFNDYNRTSKVHLANFYLKYWYFKYIHPTLPGNPPWINEMRMMYIWELARAISHELGHSINLRHDADGHYGTNQCKYSIMNQNFSFNCPGTFLPATEVGRIHMGLSTSNLRNFVVGDPHVGVKYINENYNFPNTRFYHSLRITSTVNFNCDVTMPTEGNIEVYGHLKVNNAQIKSFGEEWNGIIVKPGALLELNSTTISDYDIVVESGGSLIVSEGLTISGNHHIKLNEGSYVCIKSGGAINLIDVYSGIRVMGNIYEGIHSKYPPQTGCTSIRNIISVGEGEIVDYNSNAYIQNEVIEGNTIKLVQGKKVYIGRNVTSSKPTGEVLVRTGASLDILAKESVEFYDGFTIEVPGVLQVDFPE